MTARRDRPDERPDADQSSPQRGSEPATLDLLADDGDRLLTPGEAAAYFRVHPKTITRWAESGQLTSVRTLGGHRRFRLSEVRALRGERT